MQSAKWHGRPARESRARCACHISKLINTAVLVKRLGMQSPKRKVALAGFVLLACFVCVQAQNQNAPTQSLVTLPSSILDRELTTIDGRQLKLSDFSNRTIVLNLFASWCGPCRMNLPDLIDLKRTYVGHPIEVIGLVSQKNDPDLDAVRTFVRDRSVNFEVIWDTENFGDSLIKAVNGRSLLPDTFIIVRGNVRKTFFGFNASMTPQQLRQTLDQIGQEPGKSP
jgi:thiol-disulfide isomerase/thioredoxin